MAAGVDGFTGSDAALDTFGLAAVPTGVTALAAVLPTGFVTGFATGFAACLFAVGFCAVGFFAAGFATGFLATGFAAILAAVFFAVLGGVFFADFGGDLDVVLAFTATLGAGFAFFSLPPLGAAFFTVAFAVLLTVLLFDFAVAKSVLQRRVAAAPWGWPFRSMRMKTVGSARGAG